MLSGRQLLERSLGRVDGSDLHVLVVDELDYRLPLICVVLYNQEVLRDISNEMRELRKCVLERFLAHRLREVCHGAGLESLLSALDSADDVNGDMACMRISLQTLENLDAIHTGHVDVERDRVGAVFLRRRKTAV